MCRLMGPFVYKISFISFEFELVSMRNNPIKLAETANFLLFFTHNRIILSGKTYAQYNIIYFEKYLLFENSNFSD